REHLERTPTGGGDCIDAPFDSLEPAIDVLLHDASPARRGGGPAQSRKPHGAMTCPKLGAAQRLLAGGGHQGEPWSPAAAGGVADAALMLAQQSTRLALVDPRPIGQRIEHDIGAVSRNDDQP